MKTAINCAFLAVVMASLSAVACAAVESVDAPKRIVHFGDLDLSTNAGAAALYARIRYAAGAVCEPFDARMWETEAAAHRCVQEAIGRAVADVNAPALTNYHLAKIGQTPAVAQR